MGRKVRRCLCDPCRTGRIPSPTRSCSGNGTRRSAPLSRFAVARCPFDVFSVVADARLVLWPRIRWSPRTEASRRGTATEAPSSRCGRKFDGHSPSAVSFYRRPSRLQRSGTRLAPTQWWALSTTTVNLRLRWTIIEFRLDFTGYRLVTRGSY